MVRSLQIALVVLAALTALEGLSSLALLGYDLAFNRVSVKAEREGEYTGFDPDIGWVARPNVRLDDLFGPGQHLTTGAFGERGTKELQPEVPAGRTRIVCAGDSFTFGYGVGDHETWPHALASLDPRLETVNLGQRGYGIDQAWLWYLRNEDVLEHQVVVLAFIQDDFRRVRWSKFQGYAKPLLARDGSGALAISNAPLPPPVRRSGWMNLNGKIARSPRLVQFVERAAFRLQGHPPHVEEMSEDLAESIILQMFTSLDRRCRERDRKLVLLYLPSIDPKSPEGLTPSMGWPRQVLARAREEGLSVVDLSLEFEALGRSSWSELFLGVKDVTYPFAQNHYNAAGNRLAAELLREAMLQQGVLE